MSSEHSWSSGHFKDGEWNESLINQQQTLGRSRLRLGEAVAVISWVVPGAEKAASCLSARSCLGVCDLIWDGIRLGWTSWEENGQAGCKCSGDSRTWWRVLAFHWSGAGKKSSKVFTYLQGDRAAESTSHQPFLHVWTDGPCEKASDGPSAPFILLLYAWKQRL